MASRRLPPHAAPLAHAIGALATDASAVVLAVSGGGDSMVLLHAMARWAPDRIAVVATYDHATGPHATEASALVTHECKRLRLPLVRERARTPGSTEAEWREARWAFLRRVARAYKAQVATAHTADDQLETIVQRLLRGAGARGLAALAAPGPVLRPLLSLTRAQLVAYREAEAIPFVADPSNLDRRHQRVRVRLDLLPAFAAVDPTFAGDMLTLGRTAAAWRADVDQLVDSMPCREVAPGVWQLDRAAISGWSSEQLAVLWPAVVARLGVTLDAAGTRRVIRFTIGGERAGELRLPGGATVVRRADAFEVRAPAVASAFAKCRAAAPVVGVAGAPLRWCGWRFSPLSGARLEQLLSQLQSSGKWTDQSAVPLNVAAFPAAAELQVRRWQAGDRVQTSQTGAVRRISRYLAECGIPRLDRSGWPVVLLDGEIVWVPDVCRGNAAPHRSGRSDLIWYRSEREFS